MSHGMTCYRRDEVLCEDVTCSRVGCRIDANDTAIETAVDLAQLAISEYYNSADRTWAERWLLKAYAANQKDDGK